jgi:hypothetical protein
MADRRLQVFHAVAKQLSFTKAAEVLFMTQPAVTFQIKQLEEHFNTRLFERGHGKISLTPAGDIVLEYAERILGLSSELDVRLGEMTGSAAVSKLLPDCPLLWAQYFREIQSVLLSWRTAYCRFRSAPTCRFCSVPRLKAVTSLNRCCCPDRRQRAARPGHDGLARR